MTTTTAEKEEDRHHDSDDRTISTTADNDVEHGSQEVILSWPEGKEKEGEETTTERSFLGICQHLEPRQRRRILVSALLAILTVLAVGFAFGSVRGDGPRGNSSNQGPTNGSLPPETQTEKGWDSTNDDHKGSSSSSPSGTNNVSTQNPKSEESQQANDSESNNNNSNSNSYYSFFLPFPDVQLSYVSSEDTTRGYSSYADWEKDLTEAAKIYINNVVLKNLGLYSPNIPAFSDANGMTWRNTAAAAADTDETTYTGDITDFETNRQELGVQESDLLQADDQYVYAAYNDYVLAWDTQGNQVAQTHVSSGDDDDTTVATTRSGIFSGASTTNKNKANIEALLLTEEHLVILVSNYYKSNKQKDNVLTDYETMHIRTYQRLVPTSTTTEQQELTLVGTKNIHGRLIDARAILVGNDHIHVTTSSAIDTYTHLGVPFERYQSEFVDMTDPAYIQAVRQRALETYIPAFVQKLGQEMSSIDGLSGTNTLPHMLRVGRWQQPTESLEQNMDAQIMLNTGILNSVTFITSFDATTFSSAVPAAASGSSSSRSRELATYTSAFLPPSRFIQVYSTDSNLVLATRAWDWNGDAETAEEVTHLILLEMTRTNADVSTTFQSIGTLRGYLLNPSSVDIITNGNNGIELRVATTVSTRWRFQPRPRGYEEMGQNEGVSIVEESRTENYITVLRIPDDGSSLQQRGFIKIGNANERIMAVRFLDKIAYCMTSLDEGPFYVIDMEQLRVLGDVEVDGFTNYLHPINEDQTMLLGIGQNADGSLTISIFDATIPSRPSITTAYSVGDRIVPQDENEPISVGSSSSSIAQWDYKSFRYVDGQLILPLVINAYSYEETGGKNGVAGAIHQTLVDSFEGFVVFTVNSNEIREHFRVSHAQPFGQCYYCGYLAPRSFIYHGHVMTVHGNTASSNDLDTGLEEWSFQVQVEGETASCCF